MRESQTFEDFMEHPMVLWIKSCLEVPGLAAQLLTKNSLLPNEEHQLSYALLCDGIVLHKIMLYIDPNPRFATHFPGHDCQPRLRNLALLLRHIQTFYQEVLQQVIVMPLPDLLIIARQPYAEGSGEEMKKILLLLLGCAVQSEKKEEFINKIKLLEVALQEAIAEQIKKVTCQADCVLNVQALELDPSDTVTATVLHQLQRVVLERDSYAQTLVEEACADHENSDSNSSASLSNGEMCAAKLPESQQHDAFHNGDDEKNHIRVELADAKAKFRRARQELEEKLELLAEYKEELSEKDNLLSKLRQENLELLKDARSAKTYRDEVDVLREKASKVDRLEIEVTRYRERSQEVDFFKARVEELREEQETLSDARRLLEEQLDQERKRSEQHQQAEQQLLHAQRTIHQLQHDLEHERTLVSDLMSDNARLDQEQQSARKRASSLEQEIDQWRKTGSREAGAMNLSNQMQDSVHNKLLKLELENQQLRNDVVRKNSIDSAAESSKVDELNRTIEKLTLKNETQLNKMQELRDRLEKSEADRTDLEDRFQADISVLKSEKISLRNELESTKSRLVSLEMRENQFCEELQANVEQLMSENETLKTELATARLRTRNVDSDLLAARKECTESQERVYVMERQKLDADNKIYVAERENRCLEKENLRLKHLLESSDAEFEKCRSQILELEREKQKLECQTRWAEQQGAKATELDIERRHLTQQLEIEQKKLTVLREDLIGEKTRVQACHSQLGSVAAALNLEGDDFMDNMRILERIHNWKLEQKKGLEELSQRLERMSQEKSEVTTQLTVLEAQRQKAKPMTSFAQQTDNDSFGSKEHQERMKQLELKNTSLCEENRHVKDQVYLLQEQIRKLQTQNQTLNVENAGVCKELSELRAHKGSQSALQSENARLAVEARSLQLQVKVLEADNHEMGQQLSRLEQDHIEVGRSFDRIQRQHSELLRDHEMLQNLHAQLTRDHERLRHELADVKSGWKQMKLDFHAQVEKHDILTKQHDELVRIRDKLEKERNEWSNEYQNFARLQSEHGALKRQFDENALRQSGLQRELDTMRNEYRALKAEFHKADMQTTQYQGQVAQAQHELRQRDMDVVKLENKCMMYDQMTGSLREELRAFAQQMDALIEQNRELLTKALRDKELHHAEEKELQEKLNALKRQKEKLEEKIMEQYKMMGSPVKTKKGGLMRRARALIGRTESKRMGTLANGGIVISGPSLDGHAVNNSSGDDSGSLLSDEGGFKHKEQKSSIADGSCDLIKDAPVLDMTQSTSTPSFDGLPHSGSSGSSMSGPAYMLHSPPIVNAPSPVPPKTPENVHRPPVAPALVLSERISLFGSERGIDVPEDPALKSRPRVQVPSASPVRGSPLRATVAGDRPPPPPSAPMTRPPIVPRGKPPPPPPAPHRNPAPKKAPPPYPGRKNSSPAAVQGKSTTKRPELTAALEFRTSTPIHRSPEEEAVPAAAFPLTNGSLAVRPQARLPVDEKQLPPGAVVYRKEGRRQQPLSFYENLDNCQDYLNNTPVTQDGGGSSSKEDSALLEELCGSSVRDSSVWYEYGCV